MLKELKDPRTAQKITLTFLSYKTPMGGAVLRDLPKKFYFQFRFFTFPDITTEYLKLDFGDHRTVGGIANPQGGFPYFLQRVSHYDDRHQV